MNRMQGFAGSRPDKPQVPYTNTKANIEAMTGGLEGAFAYATDTNEFGTYNGAVWAWGLGALTNGQSVLGAGFTITGAAGVYQDTGLSVTLPSSGLYKVTARVRTQLIGSAGTSWWLQSKFHNSTDAVDIVDSETMLVITTQTPRIGCSSYMESYITVTASKVVKLYAARNGAGSPTWTESIIPSDSNGKTSMSYVKIGDV